MSFGRMLMKAYPLVSGAGTVVNTSLFKTAFPPSGRQEWAAVEGGEVLVALDDHVGRAIHYTGDLDQKISWVIDRCVKPGDIALDIGANYGLTALRMAARTGSTGQVHAFEPNPEILVFLRQTLARNSVPVDLHEVALGDEAGELTLFTPLGNAGGASLARGDRAGSDRGELVRVVTLTEHAREVGLERCDFIKIDVEGFEHKALKGGAEFLERFRPRAIVLEEFQRPAPGRLPPSLQLLAEMGYELHALPIRLFRIGLEPVDRMSDGRVHDYVAISPECPLEVRQALGTA